MKTRLIRWLADPRWDLVSAALALLLTLPALRGGLYGDDYMHRAVLLGGRGLTYDTSPVMDLFSFIPGTPEGNRVLVERGTIAWWSHPEIRLSFLRPVAALSHVFDYQLWPHNFALQHGHSLLWFVVAVLMVVRLFREIHGPTAVAGLAGLLFAVEDAHAIPASWLANRSSNLALVFGVLAVLRHLRWRREGRAWDLGLAVACLAVGLLCGEVALGAAAYMLAWELCLGAGKWWRRLAALAPYGVLIVGWRVIYSVLGFGATGSGLYVDPAREPIAFASALVKRGPVLLLGQWTQVPSDLWSFLSRPRHLALTGIGLVLIGVLGMLLAGLLRARPEARFWAVGMLLATVPLCAAFPMDRLLVFSGIGACGLLALQAERLGWLNGPAVPGSGRLARAAGGFLLVLHLPMAALLLPLRIVAFSRIAGGFQDTFLRLPDDENVPEQTFVFVNGHDLIVAEALVARVVEGGRAPSRIAVLSPFSSAVDATRTDAHTLHIRPAEGFLPLAFDRISRGPEPAFSTGQRIARPGFTVEVLEVTADGRPAKASFRFGLPLEDRELRWFCWRGGRLEEFSLPSPGESVRLEAIRMIDF